MAVTTSLLGRSLSTSLRHISRPSLPQLHLLVPLLDSINVRRHADSPEWGRRQPVAHFNRSFSSSPSNGPSDASEWFERVRTGWNSIRDMAGETLDNVIVPYTNELNQSHPYLKEFAGPVSGTLVATGLVWFVMPRIFKRIHLYAAKTRAKVFMTDADVPYDKSFWGALEDPLRYLVTFFAFSQVGMLAAPTIVAQYLQQAWRGAAIASLIWLLYRLKTNWIEKALSSPNVTAVDKERILTLDNISSIGLFAVGVMSFAEACGVAVQSILTVGGIGGVATAFAAKDVLGNVLSGLSIQFSHPFSVGDTIKAGSIEGKVMSVGLTSTLLLTSENYPVLVPNALFSSQAIVNKSRAQWRAIITKIPLTVESVEMVATISSDIKSMLCNHEQNLVLKEPLCYLSGIQDSCAELTIGYDIKHMAKERQYMMQQDILLRSVEIVKKHGGALCTSYGASKGI